MMTDMKDNTAGRKHCKELFLRASIDDLINWEHYAFHMIEKEFASFLEVNYSRLYTIHVILCNYELDRKFLSEVLIFIQLVMNIYNTLRIRLII